ncbi:hypothetical protein [Leifsonia xyli]|uniref:hypothetical protein n=1 Tax=Leifsonia xyli TaxID=1575 RepID=UPI000A9C266A|nr:hypothetical protein [Leifsonia xyli]
MKLPVIDRVTGEPIRHYEHDHPGSLNHVDVTKFVLCNDIAYNGIMVNGVKRRLDDPDKPDIFDSTTGPIVAPSRWIDEPAPTQGTHLQDEPDRPVREALAYLADHGIPPDQVIAISPFRAVADRLDSLSRRYPGLTAGHDPHCPGPGSVSGVPCPRRRSSNYCTSSLVLLRHNSAPSPECGRSVR